MHKKHRKFNFNCLKFILFIVTLIFFGSNHVYAFDEDFQQQKLTSYLIKEKENLSTAVENLTRKSVSPIDWNDYEKKIQEIEVLRSLNTSRMLNLDNFSLNQKKIQHDFNLQIKKLQEEPGSPEKQEKINNFNQINKKINSLINENLNLSRNYEESLEQYQQQIEFWKVKFNMQMQLKKLTVEEGKLNLQLSKLYDESLILQTDLNQKSKLDANTLVAEKLLLNNQLIILMQAKLSELGIKKKLVKTDYYLLKTPDIKTLNAITETFKNAIHDLKDVETALKKIELILSKESLRIFDNNLKQQFIEVHQAVNAQIKAVTLQKQALEEDLDIHQGELKKQLSTRQSLAKYQLDSVPLILSQLLHIPAQIISYLKALLIKIKENYLWSNFFHITLSIFIPALIGLIFWFSNKLLKNLIIETERSRLSGHLYDGILILLSRNMLQLGVAAATISFLFLNNIPFANYRLLINLFILWLTFRLAILIARLALLERISDTSGKDVRLYYKIKNLLLIGGWITALMVIGHQLNLSLFLQDIFNRLFMLFLFAVSLVSWKSKDVIVHLLYPFLKTRKRYVRNAIFLLLILIPITLGVISIIGLLGYVNLAWSISKYQLQILFIITAYVLSRGLIVDALELLSELMVSNLQNGWLWVEVLLKPLDKILRIMLIIFCLFLLFQVLGWYSDPAVMTGLLNFGHYPIVNISGIYITGISILEFIVLLYVFIWAAKWTREFSYRWLYRNARDTGIRNSLSVFTQYAVVLIGGFITLRVLGLDFSGMSMVLGGLAVGMGFGLRDFASNIIGGLMLLIERPLREGDLITIDNYEGMVAHIGIRSIRVCSWDNMEVLIPNAEVFSKPFTNWTHQDSIVRTVVPVKISRVDDPFIVQQLILDVLAVIPEIMPDPAAQVFLKKIDEALMEFEVRYFINVQLHTRFEIQSKVLFAIYAQFKAAGIKEPIPPMSIELQGADKIEKK